MNSTLKLVLPIGLVVLIVFGITFISSYAPPSPTGPGTTGPGTTAPAQLLRLSRVEAKYAPDSDDPAARFTSGIYEPGPEERPSSFWFQNVNAFPVRLAVLDRSCTACTSARVATLPNDAVTQFVTRKNVGLPPVVLAFGTFPVPDLAGAVAAAALLRPLQWKEFDFNQKGESTEVPPGSDTAPTWGVFQFGVKVGVPGPVARHVLVGLQAGQEPEQRVRYTVNLVGLAPFSVTPHDLNFSEVPEDGNPRTSDVFYWSATRGPNELPPPEVRTPPDDPLVGAGTPVKLSGPELQGLARQIQGDPEKNAPLVVLSAWRIPVTLLPKPASGAPAQVPDIGPFERTVAVIGPGTEPGRVTVRGTVTGLVALKDGANLKFGQFDGRSDTSRTVTLVSAKTDLELETVPGEFKPVWLKVELSPPSTNGARREWTMKVTIPADSGLGDLPPDAAVVLKTREPNPRRIRLPVSGSISRR